MSDLTLAGAAGRAPVSAAELAARIPVPQRLPERHDGEPLRHLSPTSYSLWVSCPEAWRRRYIKGEKPPPTGSMFLGSRVDDALSAYYRRILEHGDRLALDQLLEISRQQWTSELEAEQDSQGVDWEEELTERDAFELGRQALELAMAELVPHLGDPVDVQRRLEFTIAPDLGWTVLCYLDLETVKEGPAGEPAPTVVDFKVKNSLITHDQADSDPQAGLYLAGRWLEANPASELCFAPDRQARQAAQADGRLAGPHKSNCRAAPRRARPHHAGGESDRRLLRALRPRSALGLRRSNELEMQLALLPRLGELPGWRGA